MLVMEAAALVVVGVVRVVVGVGLLASAVLLAERSRHFVARGIERCSPRSSTHSYSTAQINR